MKVQNFDGFNAIVNQLICEIGKSSNVSAKSIHFISSHFNNISSNEQNKYSLKIKEIQNTIKGYNINGNIDFNLTSKQTNTLFELLKSAVNNPYEPYFKNKKSNVTINNEVYYDNFDDYWKNKKANNLSYPSFYNNNNTNINNSQQFDTDDIIFPVVFNLLTNLSKDVMGSTLTTFVAEYFDTLSLYLSTEENLNKYFNLTQEIEKCLEKYGWNYPSNDSSIKCFCTEPNRIKLVEDLQTIVNNYFLF